MMQRSWRTARFLIASTALGALLPSCGDARVELKLVVKLAGTDSVVVEKAFPGDEPRIELMAGETYDFELHGRLEGDVDYLDPAVRDDNASDYFRLTVDGVSGGVKRQAELDMLTSLTLVGTPGRVEDGEFRPNGVEPTTVVVTIAIAGVTPSVELEVEGRGAIEINGEEFREGQSILDFEIGASPQFKVMDTVAFQGWQGDCVAMAGIDAMATEFTLNLGRGERVGCKAAFLPEPVEINVSVRSTDGMAAGRVTSAGTTLAGTIDCGVADETCVATIEQNSDFQLIVDTHADYLFTGWSDAACDGLTNPGVKEVTSDLQCIAMFRPTCEQTVVNVAQSQVGDDGIYNVTAGDQAVKVTFGTSTDVPVGVEYAIYEGDGPVEFQVVDVSNSDGGVSVEVLPEIGVFQTYTLDVRITHDSCGTAASQTAELKLTIRGT